MLRHRGFSEYFTLAGIYVLFLVVGLVVLAMLLILYGVECAFVTAREGRVQPVRLRHTGEPPELSLAKDQRFNIFISRTPPPPRPLTHMKDHPVDPHEASCPVCFTPLAATPTCAFSSSLRCRRVVHRPGCGGYHVSDAALELI